MLPEKIKRDSDRKNAGKRCAQCDCALARHAWEKPNELSKRQFCSRVCSAAARRYYISTHEMLLNNSIRREANGCWDWLMHQDPKGYGRVGRRLDGEVLAHRISYREFKGPIPCGLHVLHSCDNPRCINPEHLRVGTNADNAADRVRRGRSARQWGPKNPNWRGGRHSKLIAYQVANDQ